MIPLVVANTALAVSNPKAPKLGGGGSVCIPALGHVLIHEPMIVSGRQDIPVGLSQSGPIPGALYRANPSLMT